jgi:dihydrofolate reductase
VEGEGLGKLVFGMMQSLDGYVAGGAGGPGSDGYVAGVAGGLELPPPGVSLHRHFVVSRSLKSVGANATLVAGDVEAFVRRLKAEVEGEIDVAGPELAGCLTDLGLIDEYRLYYRPFVLGRGKPFFSGPRPPLRLVTSELVGEDVIRLTYVPA